MAETKRTIYENPVKMFIQDVLQIERDMPNSKYFYYHGSKIRKVDIMGVVTEVRQFPNAHLYRLDDATGAIQCRVTIHMLTQPQVEIDYLQEKVNEIILKRESEINTAMEHIVNEIFQKHASLTSPLKQGKVAHVQGFISDNHGEKEITAFKICEVCSVEEEIDRIYEMCYLFSSKYEDLYLHDSASFKLEFS